MNYRYQRKHDLALEEMDKAFALAPTDGLSIRRKGDIYFYMGDLKKAEEEYRKLLEKEEPTGRRDGMQRLGSLFLLQGRFKDSIDMAKRGLKQAEELGEKTWIRGATAGLSYAELRSGNPERALELIEKNWNSAVEDEHLNGQRSALSRKAVIYLEMERLAEAQKATQELKEMMEQGMNKNRMRRYYLLMGMIEIERKDYSKANEYFKKGLPLLSPTFGPHLLYADSIGLAYFKSGDLEKAREEYERIGSLTTGRLASGDVYAKSFYMLGKIYEHQGSRAKAIENYEKFLDLWKNAQKHALINCKRVP
jgi:tetratricopeptide (TPR) repeat protein